jgi:hypothetical protein
MFVTQNMKLLFYSERQFSVEVLWFAVFQIRLKFPFDNGIVSCKKQGIWHIGSRTGTGKLSRLIHGNIDNNHCVFVGCAGRKSGFNRLDCRHSPTLIPRKNKR